MPPVFWEKGSSDSPDSRRFETSFRVAVVLVAAETGGDGVEGVEAGVAGFGAAGLAGTAVGADWFDDVEVFGDVVVLGGDEVEDDAARAGYEDDG